MQEIERRQLLIGFLGVFAAAPCRPSTGHTEPGPATIEARFPSPAGFGRLPSAPDTFASWLRKHPLLPPDAPVLLHTGAAKPRQNLHAAVLDIDIGPRDLQQCADAVMRLRAEWLYATARADRISFNDTGGGKPMIWTRWASGERPSPDGNRLVWSRRAPADSSRASFRRYLDTVFAWAGTASLERELQPIGAGAVEPGDVIIRGGFPGHAVLVVDAVQERSGATRRVLLAQSYMPAQSIHILKNLSEPSISPWYELRDGNPVSTPEWEFPAGSLRRWR